MCASQRVNRCINIPGTINSDFCWLPHPHEVVAITVDLWLRAIHNQDTSFNLNMPQCSFISQVSQAHNVARSYGSHRCAAQHRSKWANFWPPAQRVEAHCE